MGFCCFAAHKIIETEQDLDFQHILNVFQIVFQQVVSFFLNQTISSEHFCNKSPNIHVEGHILSNFHFVHSQSVKKRSFYSHKVILLLCYNMFICLAYPLQRQLMLLLSVTVISHCCQWWQGLCYSQNFWKTPGNLRFSSSGPWRMQ